VWTSTDSSIQGYTQTFYTSKTTSIVDQSGIDDNVGSYNSLYLTARCEDGRPLLFGTHGSFLLGSWIDVWEVYGLGSSNIWLKKVSKRRISNSIVEHGIRPIFLEGVTLVPTEDGNGATIYASPHDFGTDGCTNGQECQAYVYKCPLRLMPGG